MDKYRGNNLELLALAVLGLGNGLFETVDGLGVEFLHLSVSFWEGFSSQECLFFFCFSFLFFFTCKRKKYLSTGNVQLNLTTVSTHQSVELLAHTLKRTQTVVLSQRRQEVLHNLALVASQSEQLLHDLLLVGDGQGRGRDDARQLAVGLEGGAQAGEGASGLVQGGGLGGGGVLFDTNISFGLIEIDSIGCCLYLVVDIDGLVVMFCRVNGEAKRLGPFLSATSNSNIHHWFPPPSIQPLMTLVHGRKTR